jgi:glycosyltransferase 2 family protein
MRRLAFLILSVLVSALFLWLAVRDVPLDQVVDSIRQANLLWVLAFLVLTGVGIGARAVRWRGLVDFKIPTVEAFYIVSITFLINQLPLRAGEVARSFLATRSKVPLFTAATSVVVERMLDTLMVVIMLLAAISRLPAVSDTITGTATVFGVAVVAAFVVLIFFSRYPAAAHQILALVTRFLPFLKRLPLERLLDNMLDGLKPLVNWRSAAHAIGWTLISWGVSILSAYFLVRALNVPDVSPNVDPILLSVTAVALASFSVAIQVTVAAIGPFELAVSEAGKAVGMAPILATSLGFLFHGANLIGYAIFGTIGLLAMGVSLSEITGQKRESPQGA